MKSDILTRLNKRKKMWISPKHPLYFENSEFKIIYCAGIFMHAQLNKTVNALFNFEFERLIKTGLMLNEKEIASVIKYASGGNRIIDEIIESLNTIQKKYLFLMDIINISARNTSVSQEENQSISIFAELLSINEKEKKYLSEFIDYAFSNQKDKCLKVFSNMIVMEMDITMSELKYYIPEIEHVTSIENKIIKKGSDLKLVDNCEIRETIIVPSGSTLQIINCKVSMYGTIVVDGGSIVIVDSILSAKNINEETLIVVKNFSYVEVMDSVINCNSRCGFIKQENGNLRITNTKINDCSKSSAIRFWGKNFLVEDSTFKNCFSIKRGGAVYFEKGDARIENCTFDHCESKKGGAIYTLSNELIVNRTNFIQCRAIEYGSGIYYTGEVGTNVTECKFIDCYPEEGVIQYLGNQLPRIIKNEYNINVSTILEQRLIVQEIGTLNIINATVYINKSIEVVGKLNIFNSKIVANNIEDRDLFCIVRAKVCRVENSEFDGKLKTGIFKASNTKMIVNNCIFRNTDKGRAIFNAYEPEINNCIFSYCLEGAIHVCAGRIYQCTFINCRDESGAGIHMYGLKGEIKGSKFIRCVADYNGGGIGLTGGHIIKQCEFEECKPNNIF